MASRQDQLHAHRLMTERLVSALVARESEPERPPLRGATGAVLAGVLVTAIMLGAVAAWGLFTAPGTEGWRQPGVLVVAEGSGARYVWRDERLHPVGSYTSALLVLGDPAPRAVTVSAQALAQAPRGAPLGIPGSPDALPPAERLASGAWTICSTVGDDGEPTSVLAIGEEPAGAVVLGAGQALLVEVTGGGRHLLSDRQQHLVRDDEVTLPALGWSGTAPVPVAPALVDALPAGPDLARPSVPGLGEPSAAVPGAVVGEVFVATGAAGAEQYAVALREGLAPLTAVQVDLLLTDPRTAAAVGQQQPRSLSQADFAALPRLDPAVLDGDGLPDVAPELAGPAGEDAVVCAVVPDEDGVAGLLLDAASPLAGAVPTAGRSADGHPLVAHVRVLPGQGVLVSAEGAVSLVTDQGIRYPVAADALAYLGYGEVAPVAMPPELVALLPTGPALDVAAARTPVPPG